MARKLRLGKFRGHTYLLAIRPEPSKIQDTEEVESFSLSVYYKTEGETIEVVRIDDAHGKVHMDRLYSERDDIKKELEEMDFWDAMDHLMQNWQRYAKHHRESQEG